MLGQTVCLRLWLRGRFQNWQTRAFRRFLTQASEELSRLYAHTGTTVRITLLETPPSWQVTVPNSGVRVAMAPASSR